MSDVAEVKLPQVSQATAVEQARAVAEVAAAVRVAQDFPRDMSQAIEQMRMSCQQKSLADRAFYSLPRAGGRVEGSTVHLARELARCFRNVEYGIRETRRDDAAGISELLAWAWDVENNVRQSRSFVVPHQRMKQGNRQALTDLSDIANNNNSVAARALRECILTLLPVWFRDEAESIAARTLAGESGDKPLPTQIADAVRHFDRTFEVSVEQMEARLARPRAKWTASDLATLRVISSELGRGEKSIEDEFPDRVISLEDIPVQLPAAKDQEPDYDAQASAEFDAAVERGEIQT